MVTLNYVLETHKPVYYNQVILCKLYATIIIIGKAMFGTYYK